MSTGLGLRGGAVALLLLAFFVFFTTAYPLCADNLEAPGRAKTNLTFCSAPEFANSGCCDPKDDAQLKATFDGMLISDTRCANVVKQILCSVCDPYSADLYGASQLSKARPVPYLCASGNGSYCNQVWGACANVNITNSPFEPGLQSIGNSSSKATAALNKFYSNDTAFCAGAAPPSSAAGGFCFSGTPLKLPQPIVHSPPAGICLEKLEDAQKGYFLNLIPHPDGSDRVFVNTQAGLMYMATLSEPGSGKPLTIDYSKPFLNISHRTEGKGELGFMGMAFHPDFLNNGRFFISYNCNTTKFPDCKGACGCSSVNRCSNVSNACTWSAIVAEYTVNATGVTPNKALQASPNEVRRIFTYGLPYENHHAGGLWFGPQDKQLYYPLGDGGSYDDPWNNAQNLNMPLGKMMRLDIDNFPGSTTGLFGNYSIPRDNPFYGVNNTRGEIWAYGLRNPWRCSFDKMQPSYFYCADVGQNNIEEVDLISKGGNYGWRVYEGTSRFYPAVSPGGYTSEDSINAIMPILEYNHTVGISIAGGYVSYSRQDACVYGSYLYADLNGFLFSAFENPPMSGKYVNSSLPFKCSSKSPLNCSDTSPLNGVISFGEDAKNDIYILGVDGVYRMVNPSLCQIECKAVLPPGPAPSPGPLPPSPPSNAASLFLILRNSAFCVILALCALVWL